MILAIGNPGAQYAGTRHNVGFDVVDLLARHHGKSFRKAHALFMEVELLGGRLIKPLTYVNRSGQVLDLLRNEGLCLEDLLVVVDDLNLDVGRIRIRAKGSDGGHNGLKDVARALGSRDYTRLRVGVSRHDGEGMKEHVLGVFDESEICEIKGVVRRAADAVESFLNGEGAQALMRDWNGA